MNLVPIKNYEDFYSLDLNNNQVYGHKYKKYKKPFLDKDGYYCITLCKNSKIKNFKLHRIIYEIYNGTIPDKMFIDHIDNNRQNNNIENLRLANRSENQHNQKVNKNNDRTNNNIENLRLATHSENSWNRKAQKNNLSTGYKNISLTKFNSYNVQIRKYKKLVYCKTFKTLEEAINNRDIQLKKFHKEFCNF